ncbi:MAG: hypothetical protein ACI84K_000280 [Pseudohongiellaceae bacterium]|jgi:hypothetical protein
MFNSELPLSPNYIERRAKFVMIKTRIAKHKLTKYENNQNSEYVHTILGLKSELYIKDKTSDL